MHDPVQSPNTDGLTSFTTPNSSRLLAGCVKPTQRFFGTVLAYRMASVGPANENEDPEVDVSAMVAEVGAESVARVQAPTLRTRGQLRAARIARQNASGEQPNSPLLQQLSGVSDDGSYYVSASDCDGASFGAPTRAHRVNDRSAPAFDMNSSYKRVKGRSHTVEKRISMLPHKPHATSQPLI